MFPIACRSPARAIERLREAGFDATAATSSIAAIDAPPDRGDLQPKASIELMRQVVFVPVYPEIPERAFRRLLRALADLEDEGLRKADLPLEAAESVRT